MKNFFALFIFVFSLNHLYAQISFEPGYYIDNSGDRIEGLIKNIDWLSNPDEFEFKENPESKVRLISINDAQVFGLDLGLIYERHSVQIDFSSDKSSSFSAFREPEYEEKTLFLKGHIIGDASLYEYYGNGVVRFFF